MNVLHVGVPRKPSVPRSYRTIVLKEDDAREADMDKDVCLVSHKKDVRIFMLIFSSCVLHAHTLA